jgi:UDP-N-acetylmuramoyl-tripeptide--D-alanyl-D-alanine ligase
MIKIDEIITVSHLKNLNEIYFRKLKSVCTDSRTIKAGGIFIALNGKNFNGHDHILSALEKGAEFAISEELRPEFPNDKICLVDNTLSTYHQIATAYRLSLNPIVIGITGSSGKTTTKEMLYKIISERYITYASKENFNNEIGVPKTILEAPLDTEVLILEMGMRGLGEISLLSKTSKPNISIITNIGTAHIERLGSVENIRKAKFEIIDGLADYNGKLSLNKTLIIDNDNYQKLINQDEKLEMNTLTFDNSRHYQVACLNSPGINADANAAAHAARVLGLTEEEIQRGLLKYSPGPGRGVILQDNEANIFIDDSYNANPESVMNSVTALCEEFTDKKKIVIIGEIAESLPELVEAMFQELRSMPQIELIDARKQDISSINSLIRSKLDGKTVVLVKASRVAGLEKIIHNFIGTNY